MHGSTDQCVFFVYHPVNGINYDIINALCNLSNRFIIAVPDTKENVTRLEGQFVRMLCFLPPA